jgi:uncharacterized protein (TIGR00369 family)
MELSDNQMCFACGARNTVGLRLEFAWEGEDYVTRFEVRPEFQGYQGIIHGGITATLCDEVMTRLIWAKGTPAATARLRVEYRRPIPIGSCVTVRGRLVRTRLGGRLYETEATIHLADGALAAKATGSSVRVPPDALSADGR